MQKLCSHNSAQKPGLAFAAPNAHDHESQFPGSIKSGTDNDRGNTSATHAHARDLSQQQLAQPQTFAIPTTASQCSCKQSAPPPGPFTDRDFCL
jgi:hypothetical protein